MARSAQSPIGGGRETGESPLVRSLHTGIAAYRWLAWAWMAAVLVVNRGALDRPFVAGALAAAALAFTAYATFLLRTDAGRLLAPAVVALELTLAVGLSVADPLVYDGPHSQSLGSAWPIAGILSAGVAFAGRGGALAGVVVGLGRLGGQLLEGGDWSDDRVLSAVSTIVLYALAGGVAGFAAIKLREAERDIALARARAEVATTLHDGVLQTLAVVQRRSDDPELARLARDQERELRDFLAGSAAAPTSLVGALRAAGSTFETRYGGRTHVVLGGDLPELSDEARDAVAGAVGEALANAGKHGEAANVTIYVDVVDGELFCSVKDDGSGFDSAATPEGTGIQRSIRERLERVGGRVEVDGRPGAGTEVRVWVGERIEP
jgi:signal transduction histidine kinase